MTKHISIHSPRMGRDEYGIGNKSRHINFNPLSPHGERPGGVMGDWLLPSISIHSPRMGRDIFQDAHLDKAVLFQSTLPAWGETQYIRYDNEWPGNFNPLSPHGERRR